MDCYLLGLSLYMFFECIYANAIGGSILLSWKRAYICLRRHFLIWLNCNIDDFTLCFDFPNFTIKTQFEERLEKFLCIHMQNKDVSISHVETEDPEMSRNAGNFPAGEMLCDTRARKRNMYLIFFLYSGFKIRWRCNWEFLSVV